MKLDMLSAPQLSSVKKQLDEEVEHLSASYTQIGAVQAKFKECARIVNTTATSLNGAFSHEFSAAVPSRVDDFRRLDRNDILVPLTNSLYVRGKLSTPDRVIVDVGTGFYVEKVSYYFRKCPRTCLTLC